MVKKGLIKELIKSVSLIKGNNFGFLRVPDSEEGEDLVSQIPTKCQY